MIKRTPSQQVRHGSVYGPGVKLQHMDARGFDRLASMDTSSGVELYLGALSTLDNAHQGTGWVIGTHTNTGLDFGNCTNANILGVIDTSTVNWDYAADALTTCNQHLPETDLPPTASILVRTGSETTWQTWVEPDRVLTGSELEHLATRPIRTNSRPLHDALTKTLARDLNDGWYVRHLWCPAALLTQLAWEFTIEGHLETACQTASYANDPHLIAVGPWPIQAGAHPQTDTSDVAIAWIERGNWLNPDFELRAIHSIAGNPALAGRWDLQDEYQQLRAERTPARVAADILLHT